MSGRARGGRGGGAGAARGAARCHPPSRSLSPLRRSDFHPESWNPVWSVASILVGLQSFMAETSQTVGSVETTVAEKLRLAAAST